MTNPLNDPEFLNSLSAAGVDNWDMYEESTSDLPEDATEDEILSALEAGGVDNWDGYDMALDQYYGQKQDAVEEEERLADEVEREEEAAELTPAESLLLSIVGQSTYDKIREGFFKRSTHPKEFEQAIRIVAEGGTLQDAQLKLVELVCGKGR